MTAWLRAWMTTHGCATPPRAGPKASMRTWKNGCKPNGGTGTSTPRIVTEQYAQSRGCRAQCAQGSGSLGRHGCSAEALGFHGVGRRQLGGLKPRLPHLFLGRTVLRNRRACGQGQAFWDALDGRGANWGRCLTAPRPCTSCAPKKGSS